MATVQASAHQRVLLHNVSWQTYETLLREFDRKPIRLTYDQGELEIMTLSHEHEHRKKLFARFIEALTEELQIPIHSGGATTFRREAKQRGLEPDECYWIQHEQAMRGRREFDFLSDPPPDLAVEVEVSSSLLDRMGVYAALGIPEIWRFVGEALHVYRLGRNGKYAEVTRSPAFPDVSVAEVLRFVRMGETQDETSVVRAFRTWVREHVLPGREKNPPAASKSRKPRKAR
jgi:Uma2 family endonuclease